MKDKILHFFDSWIYWSIVIVPFSVAISSGLSNVFVGFMCVPFLIKKFLKKEKFFIHNTPLHWAFIALVVFSIISFRNSVDMHASFSGIMKLLKYLLIFLICSEEIKDMKQIKRIVISIAFGAFLIGVDAVWQLAFGKDFIRGYTLFFDSITPDYVMGIGRVRTSFGDPNVMGVYLALVTPLVIGLALFYYRGKKRILILCASFFAFLGIVLTFSRGSALGIYIALIYMGIVKRHKLLIIVLLGVLLLSPFVMPKSIKDWAKEMHYNPIAVVFNYERISKYKNALNIIKHHPFVGVGVNTFVLNYGKYKLIEPENATTPESSYAHNIYLHMAVEIGLLGLGVFLWFLFLLFQQGSILYHKLHDEYLRIIALSLLACYVAFLVNGLTETCLYYPRVVIIFWYFIGFLLALRKFSNEDKKV